MIQTNTTRPAAQREVPPGSRAHSGTSSTLGSIVTLAGWQLRQTWRLLLVIGMGTIVAVILVCAIPLYAQVSLSAGAQHTLAADPQNAYLIVHAQSQLFSKSAFNNVQQGLSERMQDYPAAGVSSTPLLSVQISPLYVTPSAFFRVVGADMVQAKNHIKLLQGRLPEATSGSTIEFVAVTQSQRALSLQLGKTFSLSYNLLNTFGKVAMENALNFRLVGIVAAAEADDPYWHGETFVPTSQVPPGNLTDVETIPVLTSNSELMNRLDTLSLVPGQQHQDWRWGIPPDLYWYYPIDSSRMDINHLSTSVNEMSGLLDSLSASPDAPPYVTGITATGSVNALLNYASRVTVVLLPMTCLAYLIAGLVLFFVLLMSDVLVERQTGAITLLRSRGASARQVLGALLGQSASLGVLAFVAGPLLAILLVLGLASLTLPAGSRSALELLTGNPLAVAQGQLERAGLVVGIAVLGMGWSLWQALRTTILVVRRESARSTRQPFWQRYKLDMGAAVVALVGFGFSLYIGSPGVLDVRTRVLILPLTSLVGTLFLLLGMLLVLLRGLPGVLQRGERLAARHRGAAPMLALAQMARAPRQALRMTLLLALAVSFALFTLIFQQTEAQRLVDSITYQVGSDFSGTIPGVLADNDLNAQQAFYRGIKGVTSVTLGTSVSMEGGSNQVLITLNAMDSSTYARTMYWTAQNGSQSISALMAQLRAGQAEAEKKHVIPAILDDAAVQSLGVSTGQQFVLADTSRPTNFVVMAIVHYLPTIYDTASGGGADTTIPQGGVLVDFSTYSDVTLAVNEEGVSATNVWLRTDSQPTDLAGVRSILLAGLYALDNGEDRRALLHSLETDPLYLTIVGVLTIGATVVLFFGLVGNFLVAWWNARIRRINFAILRALGCEPGLIARVLLWEQGIVYGAGLLLGVLLSVVFSLFVLPVFVFSPVSGASSAETFYLVQTVPSIQVSMSVWSVVGLLVGIALICALALGLMQRVVIRPQLGQILRLDED